jgi:predicted nuclease with TOPRIM domain
MSIKYTKHFLNKLEDIFSESDYILRYEKGNFKSGYCILKETKVAIINKYYSMEGKINCIVEILQSIDIDPSKLTDSNKKLYAEISQLDLKV